MNRLLNRQHDRITALTAAINRALDCALSAEAETLLRDALASAPDPHEGPTHE